MVICWVVGRSLLLLCGFITQALWMVVIGALFWIFEVFPGPGYTRIMQQIYPSNVRGKAMSVVRLGRVSAILLVTPLAGWALDHWDYRLLFPVAALIGIWAAIYFTHVDVDEGPLPPRKTKTFSELGQILREDRRFTFYLFVFVIFGMGTLLSWTLYPIIQVDRLQLSYAQIGVLGLVQSLFWLLGFLYWGQQVDRRGGLFVVRATCAVNILLPATYLFANSGWMLLPAFMAQGLTMAGWDMGMINAGIQLADPDRVTEYAALQATITGLRGLIAPLITVLLLSLGVPYNGIFATSVILIGLSWVLFGYIRVPAPNESELQTQQRLRLRWPLRPRIPRP
jgi:predicted MFS family arabinose efflux permease